jgi:hopanoid biosynthesis associated protein HpnK
MKTLIVNGDDFGLSREVNAGIIRSNQAGILNSASLMVAEKACDEAIEYTRQTAALDVGLHLVVCKGRSTLGAARLGSLVDSMGRFGESPVSTGMQYFFDRAAREPLKAECRAQIEAHLRRVGYLHHIDGHLNFHVHPVIADILIELAVEYRVPCLRLPREELFTSLKLAPQRAARKVIEALIFRVLSLRTRRKMKQHGLKTTDWLFGLYQSGNWNEAYMLGVISRLREGSTELYFHPAMSVGANPPDPKAQLETEMLCSEKITAAITANRVKLSTFAELARR